MARCNCDITPWLLCRECRAEKLRLLESFGASSSGDMEREEAPEEDLDRIETFIRFLSGVLLLEAGLLGWDPMSDMANRGYEVKQELRQTRCAA